MSSLGHFAATLALAMSVPCGAESLQADPSFVEVRIESHPRGWGYAHKSVRPDGSIAGSHFSGGLEAPRVYESKSQLSTADFIELRALLKEIKAHPPKVAPAPDREETGYTSVVIKTGESPEAAFHAAWGARFDIPAVQAIWNLIHKYDVGAW